MRTTPNPAWLELIQLIPILVLAFPFIVAGSVDLSQAGNGFLAGALLSIPIMLTVRWKGGLLNPILIGTNLWLGLGAVAFKLQLAHVTDWLVETQALGLFVAVLLVGVVSTWLLPEGYIACKSHSASWLRRTSLGLLGLTALTVVWAWLFRQNIRLGGGLPFIVLNVTRRVLSVRAPGNRTAPA